MKMIGVLKNPIKQVDIKIIVFKAIKVEYINNVKLRIVRVRAVIRNSFRTCPLCLPSLYLFIIDRQKITLPAMPIPLFKVPSVP